MYNIIPVVLVQQGLAPEVPTGYNSTEKLSAHRQQKEEETTFTQQRIVALNLFVHIYIIHICDRS